MPMATKFGKIVTYLDSNLRERLKPLYLHFQRAYGHQTWQNGNMPWWTPAHKVKLLFDHTVL